MDYNQGADYPVLKSAVLRPLRERLTDRLVTAKAAVEELEAAIKLLDENPVFEKIQNALQRVGF